MPTSTTTTDDVLASARNDLEAQLKVVHSEIARLESEERTLTQALSSLDGGGASKAADGADGRRRSSAGRRTTRSRKTSTRKPSAGRRSRRGTGHSTADRVEELRQLLVAGAKSRNDIAAALKVSPARVQQLLAELGSSVSSQPDPNNRRGKLWSLKGSADGARAPKAATTRRDRASGGSDSKQGRRRKSAAT